MKTIIATVALGASLLSTQALAQPQTPPANAPAVQAQPGQRGGWMQQGPQTRDQAKQRADMLFNRFDLNHDGTVTRQEVDQVLAMMSSGDDSGRADRMERMVDRMFGNAQSITLVQFETQALARFDAMDLNHDGTVTPEERQQARGQQPRGQ